MHLLILLAACWSDPPPVVAPVPVTVAPPLPPPPRRGVAEVATPDSLLRATQVVDQEPPVRLDVGVDFDRTTYAEMSSALDSWGFSRLDGDGETLRVEGEGVDNILRLIAVPGIARVTPAVDRNVLGDGSFRKGQEQYGTLTHTWRWPDGAPAEETATGGALPPEPEVPLALPAGARSCLEPLWDDLTMGVSVGVGWERALSKDGVWAVVLEAYGACDARGWMVLRPDANVDNVTFGGRSVADADDAHFQDLAIRWLTLPQPDMDPGVLSAVQFLNGAENAVLARAVREVWPGQAQIQLLEAFTGRDPDGALAVAGGATTRILRAQALGQDEDARKKVLADPASPPSAIAAALVGWRPGANDQAALERFLVSTDPQVRGRAWEARFASTAASCSGRDPIKDPSGTWVDCPAPRVIIANSLHKSEPAAAEALVVGTLANPETVETGVAAVRIAASLEMWTGLVACADSMTVSRDVRLAALQALIAAGRPEANDLATRRGSFIGLPKALIPTAATAAPAVVGVDK